MTTDIPMLRDGTVYEVYIIRKNGDCSKNEIKAIEKLFSSIAFFLTLGITIRQI